MTNETMNLLMYGVGILFMLIVPVLLLLFRKKLITNGKIWAYSFLAAFLGAIGSTIAGAIIIAFSDATPNSAYMPGYVLPTILIHFWLKKAFFDRGLLTWTPKRK